MNCMMKKRVSVFSALVAVGLLFPMSAVAQLSSNADKFLGNITTSYSVDYGSEPFYTLWNQITPENESKWESVEGRGRGVFNWGGCDNAYNYAKQHSFPFKFHCLIWGAQYPSWLNNLSPEEQYKAIEEWMDAIKAHYPDLPMIDVVNEAVAGHQPAPYKAALGGDGRTGYDWIIKAFEMAHERWPDAILIYNDYNTFQWQRQQFIDLVRTLRDSGAPIDAYGCQSHDLTDMNVNDFKAAMTEIQNALKMPMYSSEYDIGTNDDQLQLQRYQEQIPYMWEADYCAGITLWGYIYGKTWTTDGNSGLIRNGQDRPAMTWLRQYMQTDAAKNAKSPFPGMVKEASVYVKASSLTVTKGDEVAIHVDARLKTKTIASVALFVNGTELGVRNAGEDLDFAYVPAEAGRYEVKAVVTATDGSTYERYSGFTAYNPRMPFNGVKTLPGIVQAEYFDMGAEGMTYHDTDSQDEGGEGIRQDAPGVDIVSGNNGYAIGYTAQGEWLEYTVNVLSSGYYDVEATVSSGVTNSSFRLELSNPETGELTPLTDVMTVPCKQSNNWDQYVDLHTRLLIPLEKGIHIIRLTIMGSSCNVDKFNFSYMDVNEGMEVALEANPFPAVLNEPTTITFTPSEPVKEVMLYMNNQYYKTLYDAPYETTFTLTQKGVYTFTAEAKDVNGKWSKVATLSLPVNNRRAPYKGEIAIPGIIEVENFDGGGEDFTFHDSDSQDEGNVGYRRDNEGVDIVTGNDGYAIGYTAQGEWLEYTVDVQQEGNYSYEAIASSGLTGSGFSLSLADAPTLVTLCQVNVPQTASNSWSTYRAIKGELNRPLQKGKHILRLTITGPYCNIDRVELKFNGDNSINDDIMIQSPQSLSPIYNVFGAKVDSNYKGIVIVKGKKILQK